MISNSAAVPGFPFEVPETHHMLMMERRGYPHLCQLGFGVQPGHCDLHDLDGYYLALVLP
jgi:hypothetical protein